MAGLVVHRSNRMEALVEVLADIVRTPPGSATARECIAVHGRGMERWLSMELARRLGVWANPDFPFPRRLIERALAAALGTDAAAGSSFEPETLRWSIADLLPRHVEDAAFAAIRSYLAGDDGVRRFQLAERIAQTFDQYVVFRPRMLFDWEGGAATHWQAALWRALVQRHGAWHTAARAHAALQALQRPGAALPDFPARVSLFGVSTLPPLYVQVLAALAQHVELHLFLLSPSAEYWADIRSRREVLRTVAERAGNDLEEALHLDEGNPLLASLGRVGREFQQVLEGTADYGEDPDSLYADPGTTTMLQCVQADILALRHRRPGNAGAPPLGVAPDDDSIAVHACHGPMREVEILHDQLLALFEQDATLAPHDVLVMSPSIDVYAPFVDAVFGAAGGRSRIPYRIADRAVRATDDVIDAFAVLITLLRGRLPASAVLDLLGRAPIRERFGLAVEDLDVARRWIDESGIRWGADAGHREQAEQPALPYNTWRFGLDRLLVGYAMPGDGRTLYHGVLPYDDVEGGGAEVLGRLADFCETLFSFRRLLQAPQSLEAWRDTLGEMLQALIAAGEPAAHQHRQIRTALAELVQQAAAGGFSAPVDVDTVQMLLAAALERDAPGRGFLTGGVTFCALVPMRSIPFRVVCLLGMNDADFPRARRPPGFDLIAQHPRLGDRSARDDDRYLFLEAVLSARERLIVTYVGRSIRDNTDIPPAAPVGELLDVIDESFIVHPFDAQMPADGHARDRVVTRHRLQPFSPRYFGAGGEPRLFSYADHYYAGARALCGHRTAPPPFVAAALADDPEAPRVIGIDALARFFENPTRAFLQQRLGLYLGADIEAVEDREPLALDALERWKVGDGLLERARRGAPIADALPAVQASGALPPGTLGKCVFDELAPEVSTLALLADRLTQGEELPALSVDHELDGTRVSGALRNLWPAGQVRYQYSRIGGRHELGVWIRHLVLNWLRPNGYPLVSYLVGRPAPRREAMIVRFRPIETAAATLGALLRLYRLGLAAPLPLFEQASRVYAEGVYAAGTAAAAHAALEQAREVFAGGDFRRGDLHDAYVRQVFAGLDPLDPRFRLAGAEQDAGGERRPGFAEAALAVFTPLLAHREEMP